MSGPLLIVIVAKSCTTEQARDKYCSISSMVKETVAGFEMKVSQQVLIKLIPDRMESKPVYILCFDASDLRKSRERMRKNEVLMHFAEAFKISDGMVGRDVVVLLTWSTIETNAAMDMTILWGKTYQMS